jgi:hypothetical protein
MRWFSSAHITLQHVSQRPTDPDQFQFVIALLGVPFSQISHFCFKRAYSIKLRRIRLAGLDSFFQSLQDEALKFNGFRSKRFSVAQLIIAFVTSSAERRLVIAAKTSAVIRVNPSRRTAAKAAGREDAGSQRRVI